MQLEKLYYRFNYPVKFIFPMESLTYYLDSHPAQVNGQALYNRLRNKTIENGTNILVLLMKCVLAWLVKTDGKRNTVWFYGPASTGKSTFARYFNTIFEAEEIVMKSGWTHNNEPSARKEASTNLVILNEFNPDLQFQGTSFEDMKTLMESNGYVVNKKAKSLEKLYVGAKVYINSQTLP